MKKRILEISTEIIATAGRPNAPAIKAIIKNIIAKVNIKHSPSKLIYIIQTGIMQRLF